VLGVRVWVSRISWQILAKSIIVSKITIGENQNKVLADIRQTIYYTLLIFVYLFVKSFL